MDVEAKQVAAWALSGTTGASAEAIASNLTGFGRKRGDYPRDAGDFGRCERLLDAVPSLRARFGEMATVNQYWAALVPRWYEIKSAPDGAKYKLIQSIITPLQDADPRVFRLGKSATLSFGGL